MRKFRCPGCGRQVTVSEAALKGQGVPVCGRCDADMMEVAVVD